MHSSRRMAATFGIGAVAALSALLPAAAHPPAGSDTTTTTDHRPHGDEPTTMVLRSAPAGDVPNPPPPNVDPALAVLAGLLVARTSADIWFRTRVPATCATLVPLSARDEEKR